MSKTLEISNKKSWGEGFDAEEVAEGGDSKKGVDDFGEESDPPSKDKESDTEWSEEDNIS